MIEHSKGVLDQLDDENLLPYFMKGLSSGAEGNEHHLFLLCNALNQSMLVGFSLIGPMGAAIAQEHASITRLSDSRRQLLKYC